MLSGFVIGVSNKKQFIDWSAIQVFLKKRFWRLYPAYALVVLFSFTITTKEHWLTGLVAHLTFTQNILCKVIYENNPLWSMNFEVLFYLCFALVSFFQLKPLTVLGTALGAGMLLLATHTAAPVLISYCFGLAFWAVGLFTAKHKFANAQYPASYFIGLTLLILCYSQVEGGAYVINLLPIPSLHKAADVNLYWVKLGDLQFIPLCFLILYSFNNKKFKGHTLILVFTYLLPLVRLLRLAYYSRLPAEMLWPASLFGCSLVLMLFPFQLKASGLKQVFAQVGTISYSIYLVHFPLACLFIQALPVLNSYLTPEASLLMYLGGTYGIAYFLEKRYQPFVVGLLTAPKPTAAAQASPASGS